MIEFKNSFTISFINPFINRHPNEHQYNLDTPLVGGHVISKYTFEPHNKSSVPVVSKIIIGAKEEKISNETLKVIRNGHFEQTIFQDFKLTLTQKTEFPNSTFTVKTYKDEEEFLITVSSTYSPFFAKISFKREIKNLLSMFESCTTYNNCL